MNSTPRLLYWMYKLTGMHLNPTGGSAEKVNLASQVMSHAVAASLNALVVTGKGHCTVCYQLHSVVKEVTNVIKPSFSKLPPPHNSPERNVIAVVCYLYISIQGRLPLVLFLRVFPCCSASAEGDGSCSTCW
jgi:hypothetical protein